MKDIDIIIPFYEAEKTIDRCLASIAMQTYADRCHVLIVDDGSSDKSTTALIGKLPMWNSIIDVEWIPCAENGGPGVARQIGLDNTEGKYVIFMDADDTFSGSYAVEKLYGAIEKDNADIVCGKFIEETGVHTFVVHEPNLVWVFGKIYRRKTIERFLVHFNETRANEDTGFNTVLANLTDNIVNIPQMVYEWHYAESTITRKDNAAYTWSSGHIGYIDNMIWAVEELRSRNINKEIIRNLAVSVLCKLYFMNEDVSANSGNASASFEKIQEFYDSAIKPIIKDGAMQFCYISEMYAKISAETMRSEREAGIMHKQTFREYLRNLGYYDDIKNVED